MGCVVHTASRLQRSHYRFFLNVAAPHSQGLDRSRHLPPPSGLHSDFLLPGHSIFLDGRTRQLRGEMKQLWSGFRRNSRELPRVSSEMVVLALYLEGMLSVNMEKKG